MAPKIGASDRPWVRVEIFDPGEYCEDGLKRRGQSEVTVPWTAITRVALGWELRGVTVLDWDFSAFQTADPRVTYWVAIFANTDLHEEIKRRFWAGPRPFMNEWTDKEGDIRSSVVWPPEDLGQPMFVAVKRHWWSWREKLAFADVSRRHAAPP